MRALAPTALALLLLLLAAPVSAQEAPPATKLTDSQAQLNADGFQAGIDGDFEKAVGLFQASLHQGEANITYLNLGRALSRLGRCDEAVDAYAKVHTSPRVDEPTHDQVLEIHDKFAAELKTECPGKLQIICEPLEMRVKIDDGEVTNCPAEPVTVAAGRHTVVGAILDNRVAEQVEVVGLETTSVTLRVEVETGGGGPTPPPQVTEKDPLLSILGWTTLGVGVAAVSVGVIYGAAVLGPDQDAFQAASSGGSRSEYDDKKSAVETGQALVIGLWAGGGALAATGVVLLVVDMMDDESAASAAKVAPWAGAGLGGLQLEVTW